MTPTDEREIPAVAELRESLLVAARHRAAPQPRRRRTPRRVLILAFAILVCAAAAGAATLLSTGTPERDSPLKSSRYGSSTAQRPVPAVTSADPRARVAWGVAPYRTAAGLTCAIAGVQRGSELGVLQAGSFHRFAPGTGGACGDLVNHALFLDIRYFAEPAPRTVVYGRARAGLTHVVARVGGRTYSARTGPGGAFLFLFAGRVTSGALKVSPGAR